MEIPTVLPRRYLIMMLVPVALILIGTVGYEVLEPDFSLVDSLYLTVMTVTTVGFGEIPHELSYSTRMFTILLMLGGIFTLFYTASEIIRAIVSGEVRTAMGRYRMELNLTRLHNHVIVCGYGRMGRLICREFDAKGQSFVVIERQADLLADFPLKHGIALAGDATSDEVLQRAGVARARALVSVVGTNADNLYITMSARLLNNKLFIVARSEDEHSEEKLRRAGANRVVSPYAIGGARVASAVLRPTVVDFIELATRREHLELQIEETVIDGKSRLVGTTFKESQLRQDYGIIIVAIKKVGGRMIFNPPSDARIEGGDILIVLGHRVQLDQLEQLAQG